MWSVDSRDYLLDGVQPLVDRLKTAALRSGDIILFHDDNSFTADALVEILHDLRQRGYSFATVSGILGAGHRHRVASRAIG